MLGDVEAGDFFRAEADARHRGNGLRRILARGGFCRQHHGVGAVQHGVRHVHDFGAGWHRVGDHRLHHLRRGNDRAVQLTGAADQRLLDADQLRIADFHAEVAAGHHDNVGGEDHVIHRVLIAYRFRALDFGDDFGIAAGIARQATSVVQVFAAAREGDGQVIDANFGGGDDVRFVFLRQRFGREAAAQLVNTLIVGQRSADGDFGEYLHALNFHDLQLYAAVVQQQNVAGNHVSRQPFIVDADFLFVAFAFTQVCVEEEFIADIEENFAFFEGGNADFRPL